MRYSKLVNYSTSKIPRSMKLFFERKQSFFCEGKWREHVQRLRYIAKIMFFVENCPIRNKDQH